jgi:hypothetical protein
MTEICQWPCLAFDLPRQEKASVFNPPRSFAEALHDSCAVQVSQLPSPAIKGADLCIKITQEEYEKGLANCKRNLHGRLTLNKGDKPVTARDLKTKLTSIWKIHGPWQLVSLGRGFYEFQFVSYEDMRLAWSMGSINLKPGMLRLSKWTNDFNSYTQRQTHTQIWIRLLELPQEYWRQRTLFEIASAIGTPLTLDESTKNRAFGHYARVLVDIDLSRRIFDEIVVEREGYAFKLAVVYEKLPLFCSHCHTIGHDTVSCKWLHPKKENIVDHGKKVVVVSKPKITSQYIAKSKGGEVGTSKRPIQLDNTISVNVQKQQNDIAAPADEHLTDTEPVHMQQQLQSNEPAPASKHDAAVRLDAQTCKTPAEQLKSTSFHLALDNVRDEVAQGHLDSNNVILQMAHTELAAQGESTPLDEEQQLANSCSVVPETQNLVVANDDDFDEVAKNDIALIRQAWADKEQPFTTVVSKSQRKKIKQLARGAGQSHNTHSKGVTSPLVLQIQSLNAVVYVAAIYANNSYLARRRLWADLTRLHSQFIGPWLFLGDFNAVLGAHEKRGKRLPPKNSCDDFLLWTSANQLSHLNTIGVHFTWAKDRELNLWHFV